MHGLINKAIETFLIDTSGPAAWQEIARRSGVFQRVGPDGFEPMQVYDDGVTRAGVEIGAAVLRRLLRFGGASFTDCLFSLEGLRGAFPPLVRHSSCRARP